MKLRILSLGLAAGDILLLTRTSMSSIALHLRASYAGTVRTPLTQALYARSVLSSLIAKMHACVAAPGR